LRRAPITGTPVRFVEIRVLADADPHPVGEYWVTLEEGVVRERP
jgi:hypothetical protein